MRSEVITIRLNSDVLDKVREEAQENLRTIAKQIEYTLKQNQKEKEN